MLPRWVEHYSQQCGGPDRLLVLDDNTNDGSTDDLPCPVIRLPERDHEEWAVTRLRMVNACRDRRCLQSFDAVMFADADEFLVADPEKLRRPARAGRPPARTSRRSARWRSTSCTGSVSSRRSTADRPILRQRRAREVHPEDVQAARSSGAPATGRPARTGCGCLRDRPGPLPVPPEVRRPRPPRGDRRLTGSRSDRGRTGAARTPTGGLAPTSSSSSWSVRWTTADSSAVPGSSRRREPSSTRSSSDARRTQLWCSTRRRPVRRRCANQPFVRIPERFATSF